MRVEGLDRQQLSSYLSSLTGESLLVTVRAARQDRRDRQIWRTLRAIRYDGDADVLMLAVDGDTADQPAVRFFVSGPKRITLVYEDTVTTMIVTDHDGAETAIGFAFADRRAAAI